MAIEISIGDQVKEFNKKLIIIGYSEDADFFVNHSGLKEEHLRIRYIDETKKWLLENISSDDKMIANNELIPDKIHLKNNVKFKLRLSQLIIRIRLLQEPNLEAKTEFETLSPPIQPSMPQQIRQSPSSEAEVARQQQQSTPSQTGFNAEEEAFLLNYTEPDKVYTFRELEKRKQILNHRRLEVVNRVWNSLCSNRQQVMSNQIKFYIFIFLLFLLSVILSFGTTNLLLGLYPMNIEEDLISNLPFNLWWWIVCSFIIFGVALSFEEGIYRNFVCVKKEIQFKTYIIMGTIMTWSGILILSVVFIVNLIYYSQVDSGNWLFALALSVSLILTMFVAGIIAGYLHYEFFDFNNIIAELESDPNLGKIVEEYRNWIRANLSSVKDKQLEGLKEKYKSLVRLKNFKYSLAVITAPFVSFGASNTVANFFPDAGILRLAGIRFNPIIWSIMTMAVLVAFVLLTKAMVKSREMHGSDVIINDGFSNSDAHGITISGPKDWRGDKKQRIIFWAGAIGILIIEMTTNLVYFVQTQGQEAFLIALMIALIPTILLVSEAVAVSNDIYKCQVQKSIIENSGERTTLL